MTEQAHAVKGDSTWGSQQAAEEWHRGATARVQTFGPATDMMLDLVKVAEGSRVLDVGAGTGDSTLVAGQRVGLSGCVLAIDISASMLELATESARQAGLNNVETRVMNAAEYLDLEPNSFDAAISRNCLMLIQDYSKALAEIRRVLKPGGRFAAIVFSTPEKCPYLSIPHTIVLRRLGQRHTALTSKQFGEFRLSTPDVLETAYREAVFQEISVHKVPTRRLFSSLTKAIQYAKGPLPLRILVDELSDEAKKQQAWCEIERELAKFVGPNGYNSPCELLIGVGRK